MNIEIEKIKKTRLYLLELIKDLSLTQVNEIPAGFNNNIIWNLGHLIVSQQALCYIRSGVKPIIDETYIAKYRPQTKPELPVEIGEFNEIKELLITLLDRLETDYNDNVFANYNTFTTAYGIEIQFNEDKSEMKLIQGGEILFTREK